MHGMLGLDWDEWASITVIIGVLQLLIVLQSQIIHLDQLAKLRAHLIPQLPLLQLVKAHLLAKTHPTRKLQATPHRHQIAHLQQQLLLKH